MAVRADQPRFTVEEYLTLDSDSDLRHEFVDGYIVAMTGASRAHNLITFNLAGILSTQLAAKPCEAYTSEMRVKVSKSGAYFYPDMVIVCEEPVLEIQGGDTLLNPTVVIEVLSPSTQLYDRGLKFARYQQVSSLQEYLLIAQDAPRVEQFVRQGDEWMPLLSEGLDKVVSLGSIACELPLARVYLKVRLAEDAE